MRKLNFRLKTGFLFLPIWEAPFDREFKDVFETINMSSRLEIVSLEKSVIEGKKKKSSNRPQIQLSGFRKTLTTGTELWQQQQRQQQQ